MKFATTLLLSSVSAATGDTCSTYLDCGWFECCGVAWDGTLADTPAAECMPDGSNETVEFAGTAIPSLQCAEGASYLALAGSAALVLASLA